MDDRNGATRLGRWETALLLTYCLLFFGLSLVGGRPLTMHEGVLPETSREMSLDHDWIIPKNGGRPWMENPPLPQWITVAIGACFGGCDRVWTTRIGPALAATLAVWLTARMATRWFGRGVGLLAGLVLATTYEFTQYAWLAEDEIFLCALCTLAIDAFVSLEFGANGQIASGGFQPFGWRPAAFLWLYVAVGLTNLAKGLMFGPVMVGVPMAGYLLWNRDWRRISHYLWAWGFLTFAVIMLAWPIAAMWRLPDVVDLWHYDHVGRLDGSYVDLTEPWWYYLKVLPTNLAPWTLLV
ncbi:MAG: ArnT family glycosyltransferase, partial [Planctomycetaceae bacterium]